MQDFFSNRKWIFLTFFVSILLFILPWPHAVVWFQPVWPALVLIFWLLMMPMQVGLGVAFFLGIAMDFLMGNLLGQHAFSFVLLAYFVLKLKPRLRVFPEWQQALVVFFLLSFLVLSNLLIMVILGFSIYSVGLNFLSALVGALIWPWFFCFMLYLRRRFGLRYSRELI